MRASGMSVRKPSRPWLIPMSGTSSGASCARDRQHRAVAADDDRDVGARRQRVRRRRRIAGEAACERAVSASIDDVVAARRPRNAARRDSGSAMPGLAWRPISATRRKAGAGAGGAAAMPSPRLKHSAARRQSRRMHDPVRRTSDGDASDRRLQPRPCCKMARMLDPRAQHLLKTLVERYVVEGQPVGSRVLSKQSGLELSPATIRNVMADLEELGYIASPHTSAGRVPTPKGYRFFVDSLMVDEAARAGRDPPPRGRAHRRPAAAAR